MAGRFGHHGPGILGLLGFLDDHGEAVEYDLIRLGLRLRDLPSPRLTWRDLRVIVWAEGGRQDSEIYKAQYGDNDSQWGLPEQLIAMIADSVNWLVWSKTKDGERNRNKPKRIPRPGVEDTKTETLGGGGSVLPMDEMLAWLDSDFRELNADTLEPVEAAPLTRAERDELICQRAREGVARKAIAAEFGISVSTVGRIIRK